MPTPPLYGAPRQKPTSQSTTPSASTLAFTSQLSSLISKNPDSASTRGRTRPSKTPKSDIFSVHNKGAQKRAAADLRDDDDTAMAQVHKRTQDIGAVDAAALHRSKRRLEEKARVYEDLKKGLYLAGESDEEMSSGTGPGTGTRTREDEYLARLRRKEKEGLIDFDRKWADAQRAKESDGSEDDDEEEDEDDDDASIVSYEDELGRTRRGTRAEAMRAAVARAQEAGEDHGPERWRPARPENLIYGAAVQAEAFNPSSAAAAEMASLAARRDRSPTPPEETHYDAEAEVRNRGTGFYAFARDEETRRKQMEELMSAREETQREREARQARRAQRERVKDERRRQIEELRTKRRAEMFLAGLGDLGALRAEAQ